MNTSPALLLLVLCSVAASAAEPKAKPKPNAENEKTKKALQLSLPSMGGVPATDGISKPKAEVAADSPKVTTSNATYAVVSAQHAKSFARSPSGSTPVGGALAEITLAGDPPATERFSTVVRVRSKERTNAPIDLVILDPRGDTVMKARGEVNFRGSKSDEVDYSVEWEPTPWPKGGEFQMLVRIAGQVMGTYPMKVVLK